MRRTLGELDRILRGRATSADAMRGGTIRIPTGRLGVLLIVLGMTYGVSMGTFAVTNRADAAPMQLLSSMLKVPLLFALTLVVTFPSLYVFNALVGSRLGLPSVWRLIIAALAVMLALLASFGPIAAFFSFTTENYAFMLLLHVVVFTVSGVIGLRFLLRTLERLATTADADEDDDADDDGAATVGIGAPVRGVFLIWIIVFGLVGAQMAWVLRPFVGNPDAPFAWLRERDSNFFESVWTMLTRLLLSSGVG